MESTATFGLVVLGIIGFVLLVLVIKTLYTVRTATAGVVERFGKFNRIVRPGLHVLIPFAEQRLHRRPAGEAGAVLGGDKDAR